MTRKKTQAEWEQDVTRLVGSDYTFLTPYQSNKVKLEVVHNVCGFSYAIAPTFFLKGVRCRKCIAKEKGERKSHTREQFIERVNSKFGNEYKVVGKYKNTNTKVTVKHTVCGTEYDIRPDSLLRGSKCKKCLYERYSKENRKTTETFAKEVSEQTNGEYELVSKYVRVKTKVSLRHNECATVYTVFPYQFIRGRRCPKCNQSKGEKLVETLLKSLNVTYESQKEFDDLRDTNKLSYDFYIPEYSILIEYQGIQHFEPVDLFGGEEQFEIQQKHDAIKRTYAKTNNYMLIEVPYTEDSYSKVKAFLMKRISL